MRLSVSKASLFDDCPYKYKLNYIDKIKPVVTPAALIKGSAIHDIFEHAYDNVETIEDLKNNIRNHQDYFLYEDQLENFITYNEMMLEKTGQFKPWHAELRLTDKDWNVIGIIDRIDKIDGKIFVTDYKTGKSHPISDYKIQLGTYQKLLKDQMDIDVDIFSVYFSKDNKILFESAKNNWQAQAEIFFNSIRNKITLKMEEANPVWPKTGKWCRWCSFYPRHCKGKE